MRPVPLLSALLLAAPLAAAEDIRDVRGVFGLWPENYEADGEEADLDLAWRLGAQYMQQLRPLETYGGAIWGIEAALTAADGDDIESRALTGAGHLGWAFRPSAQPKLHFEGTGFLGAGLEMVDAGGDDDIAPVIEYGLRAGGFYTLENRWQLGIDLRWLLGSMSEQELNGTEFDWENDGPAALVAVGWRI